MSRVCGAETFVVALYEGGSPPLFFEKDSAEKGIYKEILALIGEITGDDFIYKYYPARRAMKLFESGGYDIEPGINPTWREGVEIQGRYSVPFADAIDVLVFRKQEVKYVTEPKDLFGQRVGTVNGFTYPKYSDAFRHGLITREDSRNELLLMAKLSRNRFDQIIIRKDTAEYRIKTDPKFSELEIGASIGFLHIMFRFHPDKIEAIERVNQAINQLRKNNKIEMVYQHYR